MMTTKDYYTRKGENYVHVLDVKETIIANAFSITMLLLLIVGINYFVQYIQTLPEYAKVLCMFALIISFIPAGLRYIEFQPIYKLRKIKVTQ